MRTTSGHGIKPFLAPAGEHEPRARSIKTFGKPGSEPGRCPCDDDDAPTHVERCVGASHVASLLFR